VAARGVNDEAKNLKRLDEANHLLTRGNARKERKQKNPWGIGKGERKQRGKKKKKPQKIKKKW